MKIMLRDVKVNYKVGRISYVQQSFDFRYWVFVREGEEGKERGGGGVRRDREREQIGFHICNCLNASLLNVNKWIRWPSREVPDNPLNVCVSLMLGGHNKIPFLLLQHGTTYFIEGAVILCVLRPCIFLKKIESNKPGLGAPVRNQVRVLLWTGLHLIARKKNSAQRKKETQKLSL